MKILSSEEIRQWDQYTIEHEPISFINLMERAAMHCVEWLLEHYPYAPSFDIFCGKGNNGGDGLAIARLLIERQYHVSVYILEFGHKGTDDFQTNLARLHKLTSTGIHFIQSETNFHPIGKGHIIIDALYGSGLNRPLEAVSANLAEHLNRSGNEIIAIDIPSGLFADRSSTGNITVQATRTISFQCYKPAFLFAENEKALGELSIIDIGLHPAYYNELTARLELLDTGIIKNIYRPRKKFAHKGDFGHALLLAGSYGKMGAAVLAAKACLRSGVGLLTCHVPAAGYTILQSTVPEAMVVVDPNKLMLTSITTLQFINYDGIGIGPGIGRTVETRQLLYQLFNDYALPVVLDADALNMMSDDKGLLKKIPAGSILTPHPKEFERMFGKAANDFDRTRIALEKAKELRSVIVLKGHHTLIALPDGKAYFNSTGNAGMATGGSGDVLTGILTGLLAQGYTSSEAAILGVYIHGLAGDYAAKERSMESMVAGDITEKIGTAFLQLAANKWG